MCQRPPTSEEDDNTYEDSNSEDDDDDVNSISVDHDQPLPRSRVRPISNVSVHGYARCTNTLLMDLQRNAVAANSLRAGQKRKKPDKRPAKKDLPRWLMEHNRWDRVVLPTLYSFAGNVEDPWKIDASVLRRVLQLIINEVYSDLDHAVITVHRESPIVIFVSVYWFLADIYSHMLYCLQAARRLNHWRIGFGERALIQLDMFFLDPKHQGKYRSSDSQKAYANEMLKDDNFTWKDPRVDWCFFGVNFIPLTFAISPTLLKEQRRSLGWVGLGRSIISRSRRSS